MERTREPIRTGRKRRARRPNLDRQVKRYVVYWLYDAAGQCLYIGRSCDVPARLKMHSERDWFTQVRSLEMAGPFSWDLAVQVEAAAIRTAEPPNNVVHTDRFSEAVTRAHARKAHSS